MESKRPPKTEPVPRPRRQNVEIHLNNKQMAAKDKAKKLVDKFRIISYGKYSIPTKNKAKQCAIIAVDEIIEAIEGMVDEDTGYRGDYYWQEVKKEIENL